MNLLLSYEIFKGLLVSANLRSSRWRTNGLGKLGTRAHPGRDGQDNACSYEMLRGYMKYPGDYDRIMVGNAGSAVLRLASTRSMEVD
jgi:hypothetical protein